MVKSFKITVNGKPYQVEIEDLSASPIRVTVDGKAFEVELEKTPSPAVRIGPVSRPAETIVPEQVVTHPPRERGGAVVGAITAPMPGKIIAVNVNVGDRVSSGDVVCTLEAMKMESAIRATQEGIVKEVKVAPQQSVGHGEVLIEFE